MSVAYARFSTLLALRSQPPADAIIPTPTTTTTGKQGIIYPATDQHFYSRKMSAKSLHTEKHVDCNKTNYATKQQGDVTSFSKHSVVKYKNQCAGFNAQNQRMYKITI